MSMRRSAGSAASRRDGGVVLVKRDEEIVARVRAGESQVDVAREFGLSAPRVSQILRGAGVAPRRTARAARDASLAVAVLPAVVGQVAAAQRRVDAARAAKADLEARIAEAFPERAEVCAESMAAEAGANDLVMALYRVVSALEGASPEERAMARNVFAAAGVPVPSVLEA